MQAMKSLIHPFLEGQPKCRKVLFLIDESDLFDCLATIDSLSQNNIETEIYVKTNRQQGEMPDYIPQKTSNKIEYLPSFEDEKVESLLNGQLIGTRIFISGPQSMVKQIKEISSSVGFTDEEIYLNGSSEEEKRVYCVKCYTYNTAKKSSTEITCSHCHTVLDVSKHFSKRLDSYLGYIRG